MFMGVVRRDRPRIGAERNKRSGGCQTAEGERPGALLARRTRTMKRCSFDARSKGQPRPLPLKGGIGNWKTLVGRAQWKISQPPSLERDEQAWREHVYRSMRAVKGSLGRSPTERCRESEVPRLG